MFKLQFSKIFDPLEQFETLTLGNSYITNATIFELYALGLLAFLIVTPQLQVVPTISQLFSVKNFLLISDLVTKHVGQAVSVCYQYIFTLWLMIVITNCVGLVPYATTPTSHVSVTFMLSASTFIGITIIGCQHHGVKFAGLFLPNGTPTAIIPLIVVIELISYIARLFSLAIRLFANLMAGHSLLRILADFTWTMLSNGGSWLLVLVIPTVLITLIVGMEAGIACLQAYVFVILVHIYLADTVHLH